jgi:predicted PurR-regulated permease PerM
MSPAAGDGGTGGSPPRRVEIEIDPGSVLVFVSVAAIGAALWAIVSIAPDMVTRIAVGVLLGVALSPLVSAVQRRASCARSTAALVVGGGMVVLLLAVVLLVAPPAVEQARQFSRELPETVEELYSWPIVGPRLEKADAAGDVSDAIDDLPAKFDDKTLADLGERVLGGALSTIVALITALGVLVDGEVLVRRVRSIVPPSRRQQADEAGRIVYQSFGSYFAGSLLVAVMNGLVVLTTGLVLGVPLAPVAGIWSMLTNFIPQIGGFLGGSFFVLLALTKSPVTAVIAAIVFLGYQQFENNVIQPAVIGSAVNLTPPATMIAALVGGAAAGVPGALVATPLIGAAKALYLDRRGQLPEKREAALTRRIKARFGQAREAVGEAVDEAVEKVREVLPGSG